MALIQHAGASQSGYPGCCPLFGLSHKMRGGVFAEVAGPMKEGDHG
jgi:hypothetical protein